MADARLSPRLGEFAALAPHRFTPVAYVQCGTRVAGTALQGSGPYVRMKRRYSDVKELEAHLRAIHEPFGKLSDAQWQHLAEHSAEKTADGDVRQHYDPGIGRAFSWPLMVDISLWDVWEKVACPVMILRGEDSDLLHASTVREMQRRGIAGKNGLVRQGGGRGVGPAPALMSDSQITLIGDLLGEEKVNTKAERVAGMK